MLKGVSKMMITQSCQNCWYNGLQYDLLGLSVEYCVLHKKILNTSMATTCHEHKRKDLALHRVQQVSDIHKQHFQSNRILRLADGMPVNGEVSDCHKDVRLLRQDEVAETDCSLNVR